MGRFRSERRGTSTTYRALNLTLAPRPAQTIAIGLATPGFKSHSANLTSGMLRRTRKRSSSLPVLSRYMGNTQEARRQSLQILNKRSMIKLWEQLDDQPQAVLGRHLLRWLNNLRVRWRAPLLVQSIRCTHRIKDTQEVVLKTHPSTGRRRLAQHTQILAHHPSEVSIQLPREKGHPNLDGWLRATRVRIQLPPQWLPGATTGPVYHRALAMV
jgi:hypothetical protein